MTEVTQTQLNRITQFRALHESGCFVLPNPWDVGTAVYLESLGFKALATTSAGFAFSRGMTDDVQTMPRDLMLGHVQEIAEAISLPVNADFQNGYADEPEQVATNVALCVATGVSGLSIEDSTGNTSTPLYDETLAVERIRAARIVIDASGMPVVLTARCEAWLVGHSTPLRVALKRLIAFADAGADCLYAPGVSNPEEIETIVKAVSPKPVNVLVSSLNANLTVARLADLGVRRISVGAALARVAWGAFIHAAESIATKGSFESFVDAVPAAKLDKVFRSRR